jgi:hypothetical protein
MSLVYSVYYHCNEFGIPFGCRNDGAHYAILETTEELTDNEDAQLILTLA